MNLSHRAQLIVAVSFLLTGCATSRVQLPPTDSAYTVVAEGSGQMDGVETIEFQGDWVILDGRRMILKENIQYIRADRKKPSELKQFKGGR